MRSFVLTAVGAVVVSSMAFAAEAAKSFGVCPVGGKAAQEDVKDEFKGKTVYFCCPGCEGELKAHPEKYTAKVNHQWAVTGQIVQVACPFSGGKLNPETAVDIDGAKVAFCCKNCQKKVNDAADDAKVEMVFAKIDKGFTLQDKCPVSGKPINTSVKTDYKGKTVYFCCAGCPKAFEADPAKYEEKLPKDE